MTRAMARSLFVLACLIGLAASATADNIFPYKTHETTLANGLKIVVVPFDSPGTVAFYIIVRTGSRDEVEPGHSGFAHFFEHMMFRGTPTYSADRYNAVLKAMGADANAFTTDDYTAYHIVGPARELRKMFEIEGDRFINLKYAEDAFKTEALAVLGEYNKNATNPFRAMSEKLRDLAFDVHTYKHTTMGFLQDIKAMPGYYDYSLKFFDRYYRPENTIILVVGDVQPQQVLDEAKTHFGAWKKGYRPPELKAEPPQTAAKSARIPWTNPTRPYLLIGYRTPAFSTADTTFPTLDILSELLFSESAPLYQELVVEKQWVDFISGSAVDHRDPYLFTISARAKAEELLPKVKETVGAAIAKLASGAVDAERLQRVKSHLRYRFALRLDSPDAVASMLAHYLNLTGRVETVNELYGQYEKVSAADVQRVAREIFSSQNETTVTLAHAGQSP